MILNQCLEIMPFYFPFYFLSDVCRYVLPVFPPNRGPCCYVTPLGAVVIYDFMCFRIKNEDKKDGVETPSPVTYGNPPLNDIRGIWRKCQGCIYDFFSSIPCLECQRTIRKAILVLYLEGSSDLLSQSLYPSDDI